MGKQTISRQNYSDQAEQAAQQQEAEIKARKKSSLRWQIAQWDTKKTSVDTQISELTTEQSNLNTYLGEWIRQKNSYTENDILSEVVIVNVFEGVAADKIQSEMQSAISEMDQTYNDVNELNGNVALQIARLKQYLSDINAKLTSLNQELNSI